jgi:hypothetical protein
MHKATLRRCIEAVAANIVLFCVCFSPAPLFEQNTPVASLVSHMFAVDLVDCDPTTFYVPLVTPAPQIGGGGEVLSWFDGRSFTEPWKVAPLVN